MLYPPPTNTLSFESTATASGHAMVASTASPPSPEKLNCPVKAYSLMIPPLTTLTRLSKVSAIKTFAEESTATANGYVRFALVATPPSPHGEVPDEHFM